MRDELREILKRFTGCCHGDWTTPVVKADAGTPGRKTSLWQWPLRSDYVRLNALVRDIYRATCASKRPPAIFWDAVSAVDRKWTGLQLVKTIIRLVDRVVAAIPAGPVTQLVQQSQRPETNVKDRERITAVIQLLKSPEVDPRIDVGLYYDLLLPLTSNKFKDAHARPKTRSEHAHKQFIRDNIVLIGWAAFVDVHRQSLLWLRKHEKGLQPFAQWIVGLGNDELNTKLQRIMYGWVPTADSIREHRKRLRGRDRTAKSRKKNQQKNVTV